VPPVLTQRLHPLQRAEPVRGHPGRIVERGEQTRQKRINSPAVGGSDSASPITYATLPGAHPGFIARG
jgi:hypothetical protein